MTLITTTTTTTAVARDKRSSRFPVFLPWNKPPGLRGTIVDGYATPQYGLGWARDSFEVFSEQPDEALGCVSNLEMMRRWVRNYRELYPNLDFYARLTFGTATEFTEDKWHCYHFFLMNSDATSIQMLMTSSGPDIIEKAKECLQIPKKDEFNLSWVRLPIRSSTYSKPHDRSFMRQFLGDMVQLEEEDESNNT